LLTGLLTSDGRVHGARLLDENGETRTVRARSVLLASGGAGQVYSDTTNPAVATGDGIAAAFAAGADLADMEFYQFHPTALSLPGVPRFLLSEALRGEGAWLVNAAGDRFMQRYHPLLELAPRDVVARAITREGLADRSGTSLPVYLDMRHVMGIDFGTRFPGISAFLHQHGLDLAHDLIPVRPAAHYLMGGVRTDVDGRTSLPGLYAAGEVACTGVHGANRLASNSLLEGLVFGARAAESMRDEMGAEASVSITESPMPANDASLLPPAEAAIQGLQQQMWEQAGLLRDAKLLESIDLSAAMAYVHTVPSARWTRREYEVRSLALVASAIVTCALARKESRGAHYRNDFPTRDDARFGTHSHLHGDAVRFGLLIPTQNANAAEPQLLR
jgi:L-aspartate oxidase